LLNIDLIDRVSFIFYLKEIISLLLHSTHCR